MGKIQAVGFYAVHKQPWHGSAEKPLPTALGSRLKGTLFPKVKRVKAVSINFPIALATLNDFMRLRGGPDATFNRC